MQNFTFERANECVCAQYSLIIIKGNTPVQESLRRLFVHMQENAIVDIYRIKLRFAVEHDASFLRWNIQRKPSGKGMRKDDDDNDDDEKNQKGKKREPLLRSRAVYFSFQ